jgi:hypothetical protein
VSRASYLLPLGEVTERLRLTRRSYAGVRSIPIAKIIGSVDRACEFDRDFHPQRRDSEARMRALEASCWRQSRPTVGSWRGASGACRAWRSSGTAGSPRSISQVFGHCMRQG